MKNKDRVHQEHLEIEQIMANLYRIFAERQETRRRVLDLLHALRERVIAHCSDEDAGGYISELTRHDLALAQKCKSLCCEHKQMIEGLDEIIRIAELRDTNTYWWQTLADKFHLISVRIDGHELREQALLDEVDDVD